VELEIIEEKKTYKLSLEYLTEIEGVFDRSEKIASSSNQAQTSTIRNENPKIDL
jgi:hypothetical protein